MRDLNRKNVSMMDLPTQMGKWAYSSRCCPFFSLFSALCKPFGYIHLITHIPPTKIFISWAVHHFKTTYPQPAQSSHNAISPPPSYNTQNPLPSQAPLRLQSFQSRRAPPPVFLCHKNSLVHPHNTLPGLSLFSTG